MIATSAGNTQSSIQSQLAAASADLSDAELDDPDFQQHQHAAGAQQANFLMDKNKKLFPQKLWELINNPSIQHCLRWSDDGQRVYLNRNEFEAYYLKTPNNQFHTQKAISFVRQMNMYGFRKVDDCYYENDNFRRDQQHLLRNMIRRHPNKGLFVTLDHHQLAAAAAAQAQALQVNQHLLHLEAQHKQRAEQALRLSNYLNGAAHHLSQHQDARCLTSESPHSIFHAHPHLHQHQQHQQHQHPASHHQLQNPSPLHHNQQQQSQQHHHLNHQHQHSPAALMQHHQQQQQHHLHSSPFERLNSQALAAAQMAQVAQKLQQQQQQLANNNNNSQQDALIVNQMQQQHQHQLNVSAQFRLPKQQLIGNNNKSPPVADLSMSKLHQHQQQSDHQQQQQHQLQQMQQLQMQMRMQPKKSRLLNDFYASLANTNETTTTATTKAINGLSKAAVAPADGENQNQEDSMQSGESGCSAEASRCSSAAQHLLVSDASGAMSQQQQRLAAMLAAAAAAAANQSDQQQQSQEGPANLSSKAASKSDSFSNSQQATNLALRPTSNINQQEQQALHETLVRSLLHFKEQHQRHPDHHLLASAAFHHQQQLSQKTLLESLASLSSAGTNSMVDQSSESAITEQRSPSPLASSSQSESRDLDSNHSQNGSSHNLVALNLAKRATKADESHANDADDEDFGIDVCESDQELRNNKNKVDNDNKVAKKAPKLEQDQEADCRREHKLPGIVSCSSLHGEEDQFAPLDGAKKVEKFLADDYDCRQRSAKRESDHDDEHEDIPDKRPKFDKKHLAALNHVDIDVDAHEDDGEHDLDIVDAEQECFKSTRAAKRLAATRLGINWLSRTLVVQMCDRRGDKLDMEALGDAARYIECFLETLFDDAALIARHQSSSTGENSPDSHTSSKDKQSSADFTTSSSMPIDSSSLSLALKLIPSKLMASVGFHEDEPLEDDSVELDQHPRSVIISSTSTSNNNNKQERHAIRSPPLDEVDICATSPMAAKAAASELD